MPVKSSINSRLILLTIALGLGTFIQILDTSIANVSIPYIAADFSVTPSQGTWVITSFAISNAIVLALTGWLSDRIGATRLFIGSTLLFSFTSWLCGVAWSFPTLVLSRILQGASAGSLIPISQSLLLTHYPPEKKGFALGLWSMIVVVAPLSGPLVGGYITDHFGWRWIFYINIPIGILSAFMTWRLIGHEPEKTKQHPIDILGLLLLVIGVSTLQIFLDKGNELDWFHSNFIRLFSFTSLLSLASFILWNTYSAHPVMEFRFFRDRNFVFGTLAASLGFLMFFGSTVVLPLWLQTQLHYTAFWAGMAITPIGIFPFFISALVGRIVQYIDPRLLVTFSFICFSLTFFWFSTLDNDSTLFQIMLPRFVQGLGLAFFFIPLLTLTLSSIPNPSIASASGIFNFIRLVAGGGIGTALYVTFWNRREVFYYEKLNVNTLKEASLFAINDVFWLTGWAFLLLIPLVWLCHFKRNEEGPAIIID